MHPLSDAERETLEAGFAFAPCFRPPPLLALPSLRSFGESGKPLRLIQQSVAEDDPDPKASSCYGLFLPEFSTLS